MNTNHLPVALPTVQAAIYRVALSLDAFLVNGIPSGVLRPIAADSFLQKTARNLIGDLASLEEELTHATDTSQVRVAEILGALRARCQQLIDLVTGLRLFRTFPVQQLRSTVAQIPPLRGECVQRIQELEALVQSAPSFYESRPGYSSTTVAGFLANLHQVFVEEWTAATAAADGGHTSTNSSHK